MEYYYQLQQWQGWQGTATTINTASSNYIVLNSAWGQWNSAIQTGANYTITQNIWNAWYPQQVGDEIVNIPHDVITNQTWDTWVAENVEESDKRQAAREAYNQVQQERLRVAALQQANRIAAEAKAKALLFEHLTLDQQAMWNAHNLFEKEINGERYKFIYGTHGNVSKLRDGKTVERFCIAPIAPHDGGFLPVEDVVLAQMLLLMSDEPDFRRIANVTPIAA